MTYHISNFSRHKIRRNGVFIALKLHCSGGRRGLPLPFFLRSGLAGSQSRYLLMAIFKVHRGLVKGPERVEGSREHTGNSFVEETLVLCVLLAWKWRADALERVSLMGS